MIQQAVAMQKVEVSRISTLGHGYPVIDWDICELFNEKSGAGMHRC
jgi:hypothetical protein